MTAVQSDLDIIYNDGITRVYGTVRTYNGSPVSYGRVFWYPRVGQRIKIEADVYGNWEAYFLEGSIGTLVIVEQGYDKKLEIPGLSSGQDGIYYEDIDPSIRFQWPTVIFHV